MFEAVFAAGWTKKTMAKKKADVFVGDQSQRVVVETAHVRNLLGWLETRLAQITFDYLEIA